MLIKITYELEDGTCKTRTAVAESVTLALKHYNWRYGHPIVCLEGHVTNKEIAAAFRAAIPWLDDGSETDPWTRKTEYMCHAIGKGSKSKFEFHYHTPAPGTPEQIACSIIQARLGYFGSGRQLHTMDSWLRAQGVKVTAGTAVQAHRLAWLKMLITEFDNKE